jgi:predicted ATP-grasp superfamily ATP-dependent carboligase
VQDLDPNMPVLVMKLGHYPLHHGVMGAIRSLGRAGVPVYGVHEDRLAPAGMSKYLTGRFVWPTMADDPQELLQGMTSIAGKIGRRAILLPTDDRAAVFVAEHGPRLWEHFCFPNQPAGLPRRLADKLELYRICRSLDVACPDVAVPASRGDVVEFSRRVLFPVMLKLTQGSIGLESSALLTSGIPPTMIADSPGELLSLFDRVEHLRAGPVLLQECIPDGEDWIVHGYCNERSECLAGFTGVKLRSYPPRTGGTTLGICRSNPALLDRAKMLFRRLGYRGILDMDWRLDHRDGQYKLLDFNPRVGAQFRLFVNRHGVDVVRAMHLDLTGRPVPGDAPPDGRTFMAEHPGCVVGVGAPGPGPGAGLAGPRGPPPSGIDGGAIPVPGSGQGTPARQYPSRRGQPLAPLLSGEIGRVSAPRVGRKKTLRGFVRRPRLVDVRIIHKIPRK